MGNVETIKSYLVELGFDVDNHSLRQFNHALQTLAANVEKYTTNPVFGIAGMFAKAGFTIAGALASIAGGAAYMMSSVAKSDLEMQMFARRMFVSTEAARGMKMALDAMGVSLEDVIMGPPELKERYSMFLGTEERMMAGMGGEQVFQQNMKRIRDVQAQLDLFKFEVQMTIMDLSGKLSKALFGDGDVLGKLQEFNKWFEKHSPEIATWIATRLTPVLQDVGAIFKDIWEVLKQIDFKGLGDDVVALVHHLRELADYLAGHKETTLDALKIGGGIAVGSVAGPVGAILGGGMGLAHTHLADVRGKIYEAAIARHIDPLLAMAIASKETGGTFDNALTGSKGEIGIFQLMPDTIKALGIKDPRNVDQNIAGGLDWFLKKLEAAHGNTFDAIRRYNGAGPAAQAYANDVWNQYQHEKSMAMPHHGILQQESMRGVDVGGVTVNVASSNASAQDIADTVVKTIREKAQLEYQRNSAYLAGNYA